MKKSLFYVLIILVLLTGCSHSNNNDSSNPKNDKTEKENIASSIEDYTVYKVSDVSVDGNMFNDVYYKIGNSSDGRYLFVKTDGSLFEYSDKKFSTTNSNVRTFNSKLNNRVIMGFANFGMMADNLKDGEYWFLLSDYSIVKFDSVSDSISYTDSFVNDGWGRENSTNHIIPIIKNSIKPNLVISWADNMRSFIVIDGNVMKIYNASGPSGDEELKVSDTRDIANYTSCVVYSDNFVKLDDDYYQYKQVNKKETDEYVDAKPKYAFVKAKLDKVDDLISYWDGNLLVTSTGNVYRTSFYN